jgi:hypothetical protein
MIDYKWEKIDISLIIKYYYCKKMNLIYAFALMKLNAWTAEIIASFHGLFCGVTRP